MESKRLVRHKFMSESLAQITRRIHNRTVRTVLKEYGTVFALFASFSEYYRSTLHKRLDE